MILLFWLNQKLLIQTFMNVAYSVVDVNLVGDGALHALAWYHLLACEGAVFKLAFKIGGGAVCQTVGLCLFVSVVGGGHSHTEERILSLWLCCGCHVAVTLLCCCHQCEASDEQRHHYFLVHFETSVWFTAAKL